MSLSDKIFEARDIVDEHYHEVVDIEDLAEAIQELKTKIAKCFCGDEFKVIDEIFGEELTK